MFCCCACAPFAPGLPVTGALDGVVEAGVDGGAGEVAEVEGREGAEVFDGLGDPADWGTAWKSLFTSITFFTFFTCPSPSFFSVLVAAEAA